MYDGRPDGSLASRDRIFFLLRNTGFKMKIGALSILGIAYTDPIVSTLD